MTRPVRCPICGSTRTAFLFDSSATKGWRGTSGGPIWRCLSCWSGFVVDTGQQHITPSMVEADPESGINPFWLREEQPHRLIWRRRIAFLEQQAPARGRLLDVGCYNGIFLDEARRAGWRVAGVEPDAAAARWAREQLGLEVYTGTTADLPADIEPFDVITLFHVIEHLSDVSAVLKDLRRLLKPDGCLIIETPDAGVWLRVLGKRFRYVQPDHLRYFSRQGLRIALAANGFRLTSIESVGKDVSVENLLQWLSLYARPLASVGSALPKALRRRTLYLNARDIMLAAARREVSPTAWPATAEASNNGQHPSLPVSDAGRDPRPARAVAKRALDIVVSSILLVCTLPLWGVIALAIKLDSPGTIFFNRPLVGKHGRPFTMYKFRTMYMDAEARLSELQALNRGGQRLIKIPNDPRVTRVGRFLRATSLDELPQLINVLRGEMSLVGPRPQYESEVAHYTPLERRRLEVAPGITGLWQVSARDSHDFNVWVRYDLEYIDRWSIWLDLKILLRTIAAVVPKLGTSSR